MSRDPRAVAGQQPSARSTVARYISGLVLLVVAFVLVIPAGGYDALGTVESRLAHQAMAYLVLGSWLVLALIQPAWRPATPLLPAIAIAVVAYGLSTLASQRPRLSLEPGLAGPAFALTYLFLAALASDRWFRRRLGVVLILAVAVVAVGYIAAVGFEWAVFYRLVGGLTLPPLRPSWTDLTLGSPNLVGTLLLVLGPLAVAVLARMSSRPWPALLLAGVIASAVFLTGSRGAYLGAALATATLFLLVASRRDWAADRRRATRVLRERPVLVIPLVLGGLVAVASLPLVIYRFAQGGDSLRLDLWRASLAIFAEHPVLGSGPGTWAQLKVEANPPGSANLILHHAHNLYIQAAAELGLVGLLAMGLLAAAVVRRLRHGFGVEGRIQAIAATIGLVGFLGQSLVDNLVNLPYVCVLIMLPLAWVDGGLVAAHRADQGASARALAGQAPPGPPMSGRRRAVVVAAALAALVAAAPVVVRIDQAAAAQAEGDRAIAADAAGALAAYDRAVAIDPDFTLYRIQRASALARVGRVAEARTELEAAVRLDPVGINLISLAQLDLELQDALAARDHIRLALERAPFELAVALNAGLMAERLGDRRLALEQLATAVALRPAIAALPLLDDAARLVPKSEVIAAARAFSSPEDAALILAYAGDPSTARAELEARPVAPGRDVLLAVVIWLGGSTSDAVDRLAAMVERNPLDYTAAGWLAGILRAEGDPRAGRYVRLVRLVQADAGPGIATNVTARLTTSDESGIGVPGYYPWAVYARAFGGNVLAPGLTLISAP